MQAESLYWDDPLTGLRGDNIEQKCTTTGKVTVRIIVLPVL